jgi:hypothetical protein
MNAPNQTPFLARVARGASTTAGLVRLTIWTALLALALTAGYHFARTRLAEGVYRDRLKTVVKDYEDLRQTYNEAVKRTAVTELLVRDDNTMCVIVRTMDGQEKTVNTPFDPTKEIYVDYVVIDGRLWIRRVFDSEHAPRDGTVIDPAFEHVDWEQQNARYGQAVYRSLAPGRWIVTVTGDGSLGLLKRGEDEQIELSPPPMVRDYPQIERELNQQIDQIGPRDVLRRLLGGEETK